MKSIAKLMAVLAVVGLVSMAWAAEGDGKEKKKPEGKPVAGVFVKMAKDSTTDLVVKVKKDKEDQAKEVVVKTDVKTIIKIDGKDATAADLAKLKEGVRVHAVLPPNGTPESPALRVVVQTKEKKEGKEGAPKEGPKDGPKDGPKGGDKGKGKEKR